MNGILVIRNGEKVCFELGQALDGRFPAPDGYEFCVRKNLIVQYFRSINYYAWKAQSWDIALVPLATGTN